MEIYQNAEQIQYRVKTLGSEINAYYRPLLLTPENPLHIIGLLNGAFMFMADLCRQLCVPCQLHFIRVSSYGDLRQSNNAPVMDWLGKDLSRFANRHVLLLDDILDTGQSLQTVLHYLENSEIQLPASINLAVLLDKPSGRGGKSLPASMTPRFVGFTLTGSATDRYVVGYGLDDAGRYRELPYLGLL